MNSHEKLPLVTIVTVAYNAIDTIEDTILSVINQDYINKEYFVIDGGSTDGTVAIIKKYESQITKWISEKDNGIYDAMNKGILLSHGDWITFRNCGDLFAEKDSLTKVFSKPFDDNVMVIHCNCYRTSEYGYKIAKPFPLSRYKVHMPVIHPATFIKGDLHRKWIFDISYKIAADYNMIYKCIESGFRFEYIPEPIVIFPEGGASDQNWQVALADMMRIQKRIYNFKGLLVFLFRYIYIYIHINYIDLIRKFFKQKTKKGWIPFPMPLKPFYNKY